MTLLVAGEVGADALMMHGVPEFNRMPPPTTTAVDLPPPWFDLARRDLPSDWFNGRVKPLLPQVLDRQQLEVLDVPGLSVAVASPQHMIAMKVRAARSDQDLRDLWILCQQIDAPSVDQVLGIADRVWGSDPIRQENRLLVRTFLVAKGLPELGADAGTQADGPDWRCPGVTSRGTQCARTVARGTTCWQH